mgnify:CR=1 FL=1
MALVTAKAIQAMMRGKAPDEMIYIRVKDQSGHRYNGRIMSLSPRPDRPSVDVQATSGEMVWNVPVPAGLWVDIRPTLDYTRTAAGGASDEEREQTDG